MITLTYWELADFILGAFIGAVIYGFIKAWMDNKK